MTTSAATATTAKSTPFHCILDEDARNKNLWTDLTGHLQTLKPTPEQKGTFESRLIMLNKVILSKLKKAEEKSRKGNCDWKLRTLLKFPVPYEHVSVYDYKTEFDKNNVWNVAKTPNFLMLYFKNKIEGYLYVETKKTNVTRTFKQLDFPIPDNSNVYLADNVQLRHAFIFRTGEFTDLKPFQIPNTIEGTRPVRSEEAQAQSEKVRKSRCFVEGRAVKCTYSDLMHASEITEPFLDGFYYYSYIKVLSKEDEPFSPVKCERIIIDFKNDKYLADQFWQIQREFEQMGYTDLEKLQRLCLISRNMFSEPSDEQFAFFNETDFSYYLGEIIRFGYGLHHHHALFIKAMAEHLGIKNVFMITSYDEVGEHSWNIAIIGKDYYVVDAYQTLFCPIEDLSHEAEDYYGTFKLWLGAF